MPTIQVEKIDERALFQMGRKYKLVDKTSTIDSLYARNLKEVEMIKREFSRLTFEVYLLELSGEELRFAS